MSDDLTPSECRAAIELRALRNCLMPTDDDTLRKTTTLVLVVGWLIWSIGLGTHVLNKGGVVLWGFTIYELFSFVVIYAFARLHDLEVKRLLGLAPGPGSEEKLDRRTRRDPHSKRERERDDGGTGGFRYGDESNRRERRRQRRDDDDT